MKKLLAIILSVTVALTMGMAVTATAFAAESELEDGSIQITPPEGTSDSVSTTYDIYKVFDATNNGNAISYRIDTVNGALTTEMGDAGFSVDSAGNVSGPDSLNQEAIQAIAGYAKHKVETVKATGSTPVVASGLGAGYYYITTTTGTLVTIDSINPSAEVIDKNTIPTVDKVITGASSYDQDGKKALAQVGTDVEFKATVTIGDGVKNTVFHDAMSQGLEYNGDVEVSGVEDGDYTVQAEPAEGDTITITFKDGIAAGTEITITYSAKVTSDALTENPATNTAKVSYGDGNETTSDVVEVYNAKFTVLKNQPAEEGEEGAVLNKEDGKYYKPLAGAGFVIKKTVNDKDAYYKLANGTVTWVDSIDEATEYTSDANGNVTPFTGLADGTYTLVEKTTPDGFNTAKDSTFTVDAHDYTAGNLQQSTTVTNNAGAELPSTGGMGTTIFYILGALLVIGCGIVLIARRRTAAK